MAYDYSKLLGKIVEVCRTQAVFARKIGLSERSVSLKLNNKQSWKQTEISLAAKVLGISTDELQTYFFTLLVQ